MGIHEECGVFGIMSPRVTDVARDVYYGLYALQHRGQESCGIVVNDDGLFASHKDLGLLGEVFTKDVLAHFPEGKMAVGHVRYGTTGATNRNNCQPVEVNHQKGRMAIAHNGNLSNAAALRSGLELAGAIFHTTSDTETIAYIITRERLRAPSIEEALSRAMNSLEGAYSLVVMSPQKLLCARDPHGFRPLCFGRTPDGTWVVASESCAVRAAGAQVVRDVMPGEILARECPADADMVIGAPDSGLDAALGYARASGIPYGIGLIKNKYIGRTFISPGQDARTDGVRIKLAAVEESVRGKRVVLVDDSIVRGNTMGRVVRLLREADAREVHVRISSPPFLHPCFYGTDIDSEENLAACRHSIPEIAAMIGADSLGYYPAEMLGRLSGGNGFCSACFTGDYPTEIPSYTGKDRFERRLSERKKEEEGAR